MGNRFASAQKALGICDVCGFQYPLRRLRSLIVKNRDTNVKACPECWEPDHPQLRLGEFPVDDPQAIRDPRPDSAEYAQSRAQIIPVRPVVGTGFIGQVTVTTS
jgi:hypothetical protein